MFNKLFFVLGLVSFVACTAKVSSDNPADHFFADGDGRPLRTSAESLNGTIDSQPLKMEAAIALVSLNGEYSITLAREDSGLTCTNFMPMTPHISFVVPATNGIYNYDGSAGGRLVNVIFPYSTTNGGGSDNILGSKSQIAVDKVTDMTIEGNVAALSPLGLNHTYEFSGRFKAKICGAIPNSPMSIVKGNQTVFEVKYTETLKTKDSSGGIKYEVRMMDKVPNKKCSTWSAWAIQEAPIHYLTVNVPEKLGNISVFRGVVEYGFEGNSSGFSTDAFDGNAKLKSLSNTEIEIALDANDYAGYGIKAIGTTKSVICP
jgi:hypothetical protein